MKPTCIRRQVGFLFSFLVGGYYDHGMFKFPNQGSNLCQSSEPSHCSDDARSLTCYTTRELLVFFKKIKGTLAMGFFLMSKLMYMGNNIWWENPKKHY